MTSLMKSRFDAAASALLAEVQALSTPAPRAPFSSPWSIPQAPLGSRVVIQAYEPELTAWAA
ncbi:hypothetical protein GCM10025867_46060 (plasmid) [Frondihabitans sucicola]|uniref:Uncharacterized protein n=1 Tax=Frondihabitans sucicola TaxID=1268041 RepID=A0ABM8GVA0_9MICO|nr:hypothetical protein [Frondihabitans sucicola]BDZ52365.1 hypothetical protein GCM10025867_46060 [Frondihabitans sucicola]